MVLSMRPHYKFLNIMTWDDLLSSWCVWPPHLDTNDRSVILESSPILFRYDAFTYFSNHQKIADIKYLTHQMCKLMTCELFRLTTILTGEVLYFFGMTLFSPASCSIVKRLLTKISHPSMLAICFSLTSQLETWRRGSRRWQPLL